MVDSAEPSTPALSNHHSTMRSTITNLEFETQPPAPSPPSTHPIPIMTIQHSFNEEERNSVVETARAAIHVAPPIEPGAEAAATFSTATTMAIENHAHDDDDAAAAVAAEHEAIVAAAAAAAAAAADEVERAAADAGVGVSTVAVAMDSSDSRDESSSRNRSTNDRFIALVPAQPPIPPPTYDLSRSNMAVNEILNDLIEYHVEMIHLDRHRRLKHWQTLNYFWNLHPAKDEKFGRLYTRKRIAELLVRACGLPPDERAFQAQKELQEKEKTVFDENQKKQRDNRIAKRRIKQEELDNDDKMRAEEEENHDDDDDADQKEGEWQFNDGYIFPEDLDREVLERWNVEKWASLVKGLVEVKALCLRKDARAVISSPLDVDFLMNDMNEKRREKNVAFTKKFEMMKKFCALHMALAPVRVALHNQIERNIQGEVVVDREDLKEMRRVIRDLAVDDAKESLGQLFVGGLENIRGSGIETLSFLPVQELRPIMTTKPFDLGWFQMKFEILMQKWSLDTFGRNDPVLIQAKYRIWTRSEVGAKVAVPKGARRCSTTHIVIRGSSYRRSSEREPRSSQGQSPNKVRRDSHVPPSEDVDDSGGGKPKARGVEEETSRVSGKIKELRQNRASLKDKHGDDPIEESRVLAAKATSSAAAGVARKRKHNDDDNDSVSTTEDGTVTSKHFEKGGDAMYSKKKSATQLSFLDDIEEDDEDDERERVRLTEVSARVRNPFPKSYTGPRPDDGVFDKDGKVVKRRRWTEEEKNAVKEGVKNIGLGKWVEIKSEYADILKNRTAVQIKDVWRTMTKNNEVTVVEYV